MPNPARTGVFVYAKDIERLSAFYQALLPMIEVHTSTELVVLQSQDIELIIHAIPPDIASTIVIKSPPEKREQTALKFFFTVPSISAARSTAAMLGGQVFTEQWQGPGFIVCNACDPEGNVFLVRESTPQQRAKVSGSVAGELEDLI